MGDNGGHDKFTDIVAREAHERIPVPARDEAGHNLGDILVNLTGIGRELSAFLYGAVSMPRAALGFSARVFQRWRKLPLHRRVPPPPPLLLQAATSYASADEDLKRYWDGLLDSAIDAETASGVHPAFGTLLQQMTALEVRLLTLMAADGPRIYDSYDAIVSSISPPSSSGEVARVSFGNLQRLELLSIGFGDGDANDDDVNSWFPDMYDGALVRPNAIAIRTRVLDSTSTMQIQLTVYSVTPYGMAFYAACTGRQWPAKNPLPSRIST
jgi:hypothetical protein